jgi:hypothetical protein
MTMSATPPSRTTSSSDRKWLPWVIAIVVVLFLAWWLMGRGKAAETGAVADTTQAMIAPDTATPAATPAPAPVETAAPAMADTTPVKGTTGSGPRIKESPRTDTAKHAVAHPPTPAPQDPGTGAMGGHGEPGKKPPATTP